MDNYWMEAGQLLEVGRTINAHFPHYDATLEIYGQELNKVFSLNFHLKLHAGG